MHTPHHCCCFLVLQEVLKRGRWLKIPAGQRVVSSIEVRTSTRQQQQAICPHSAAEARDNHVNSVHHTRRQAAEACISSTLNSNTSNHVDVASHYLNQLPLLAAALQLYEHVYLLVEGCCSFINPCCPSSPASPAALSPAHSAATHGPLQRLNSATLAGLQQQTQQQADLGHFSLTRSRTLSDDMPMVRATDVEMSFSSAFLDTQPVTLQRPLPAAAGVDSHSASAGVISLPPAVGSGALFGSISFAVQREQYEVAEELSSAAAALGIPAAAALAAGQNTARAAAGIAGSPPATPQKTAHDAFASKLKTAQRLLRSGHIFSLSALNVFGVYIGVSADCIPSIGLAICHVNL